MNVYVAQPSDTTSTGSYVGVETNDQTMPLNYKGSIQLRSTTIGVGTVANGPPNTTYTSSDILQTTPPDILDPTYLASNGIQIGPGTDLVTKSAGEKGFSTYVYPTIIYYGLKGNISAMNNTAGWLWPGTQQVSNNNFPDTGEPYAYFRVQQPSLLSGLSASCTILPTGTDTVTLLVQYTPAGGTSPANTKNTVFTLTFSASSPLNQTFYKGSVRLNTGDKIHVKLSKTDNNTSGHDFTVQLDLF